MSFHRSTAAILCALAALGGAALFVAPTGAQEILPGIYRLRGIDPSLPQGDLQPLDRILDGAEVVGLGEAVHTTDGFSRAKARLFEYLVELLGFRAFGFESPWIWAEPVSDYVATCEGTPEEAIEGLFGVWQNTAVRDLVRWMCAFNRRHPNDPVRFYGFDIQGQSDDDVARLRPLLERIGFGPHSRRSRLLGRCADSFAFTASPRPRHRKCVKNLDRLWRFLERHEEAILKELTPAELEWARIHVVGLRAWENTVFYQDTDFARSHSERDLGMAYVAAAIRRIRFPDARTALWAHNGHVSETTLLPGIRDMGVHLRTAFGAAYATIGLFAREADVNWPSVGCGLWNTAPPGSVEDLLHGLGPDTLLVDLAFPGTDDPFFEPGRAYSINWTRSAVPAEAFDALLWLEHAERMESLAWPQCTGG